MLRVLLLLVCLGVSAVQAAGPTFRARDVHNEFYGDWLQNTTLVTRYNQGLAWWTFQSGTTNVISHYKDNAGGTAWAGTVSSPQVSLGPRFQCPAGATLSGGDMCTCDAVAVPVVDSDGRIACGTASSGVGSGSTGSATYGGPLQGTGLGSAMFILTCEPDASLSQSVAPCPSADGTHTKPVMHDAYVLDYDAGATLAPLSQPFDYSKAAAFWGLAFSSVFVWWLFGQGMGQFLGIAKRAGRS